MEEAIRRLEALKAEYEKALDVMFASKGYYERNRAKVAVIEEAIDRLKD